MNLLYISLLLLVAAISIANASPASTYPSKVSQCRWLLSTEKSFCKAWLKGALPTQSTLELSTTSVVIAAKPTQTITSTITASATPLQETQVVATFTATSTITQTSSVTESDTYTTVALVTVPATVSQTTTITNVATVTTISTDVVTQLSTTYITTTPLYYAPLTTSLSKRNLPKEQMLARSSTPEKLQVISSYADAIITDACLLLLYGAYTKPATTTTKVSLTTSTPAPATVTAAPITVPASSTPTVTVPSTLTELKTVTVAETTTETISSSTTATSTVTAYQTSLQTVTQYATSTSFSSTITTTSTGTTRIEIFPTKTLLPTPIASGKGAIIITGGDIGLIGQFFYNYGALVIFSTKPTFYNLDPNTGYVVTQSGQKLAKSIYDGNADDLQEVDSLFDSQFDFNEGAYAYLFCQAPNGAFSCTSGSPRIQNQFYNSQAQLRVASGTHTDVAQLTLAFVSYN